jgi:hypothetical protein
MNNGSKGRCVTVTPSGMMSIHPKAGQTRPKPLFEEVGVCKQKIAHFLPRPAPKLEAHFASAKGSRHQTFLHHSGRFSLFEIPVGCLQVRASCRKQNAKDRTKQKLCPVQSVGLAGSSETGLFAEARCRCDRCWLGCASAQAECSRSDGQRCNDFNEFHSDISPSFLRRLRCGDLVILLAARKDFRNFF